MKKLISICITTLLLSSCSGDFLDLAPQHTVSIRRNAPFTF